ncbi:MAG: hypothetical protein QNJ54_22075 [Prochloraceae cyanobacterium]|nr:hypothetical protein [Prochloraceae cyanobacterium]
MFKLKIISIYAKKAQSDGAGSDDIIFEVDGIKKIDKRPFQTGEIMKNDDNSPLFEIPIGSNDKRELVLKDYDLNPSDIDYIGSYTVDAANVEFGVEDIATIVGANSEYSIRYIIEE